MKAPAISWKARALMAEAENQQLRHKMLMILSLSLKAGEVADEHLNSIKPKAA